MSDVNDAGSAAYAEIKSEKLRTLTNSEGYKTVEDMLTTQGLEGTVPAICMEIDCDYTTNMEPDQTMGWCPQCKKWTMVSMLKLADIL